MTITTIRLELPDGPIELLPCPANPALGKLKALRAYLVELQSYWIESSFSVGDVAGSDRGWELMGLILALLPVKGCPGASFSNLDAIASDYPLIEKLFFCEAIRVEKAEQIHGWVVAKFFMDDFDGCQLTRLHLFNHRQILSEASELWSQRQEIKAAQFEQSIKDDPEAQKLLATSETVSDPGEVTNV